MVYLSGVFCALKDMGLFDCCTYTSGLSGSNWYANNSSFVVYYNAAQRMADLGVRVEFKLKLHY